MATATPVPTSARWNGASSTSSATVRSAPASPGNAYRGAVASGELKWTGTSTSVIGESATGATLTARSPRGAQVGQHPVGQSLRRLAVPPAGDRRSQEERRGARDPTGHPPRHPTADRTQTRAAEYRDHGGDGGALDGALGRPAGQIGRRPVPGVPGGRPAVQLV